MSERFYLVLDQGGHSSRAILFDDCGEQMAAQARTVDTQRIGGNRVEQDPLELVESLESATRAVLADLSPEQRHRVKAGSLVTQRSSLVCWRRSDGSPLSPVLSWQDTRGADQIARLPGEREWVRQVTGLVANAHYGASKMRWCLDNLSAVNRALESDDLQMGPLVAYLARCLAGRAVTDPGNGSRTLLMNLQNLDWDDRLLTLFGIPRGVLVPIVSTRCRVGAIRAAGTNLPLALLNGDQCAAFYGGGEPERGTAYINAGTGAFVATLIDESQPLPPGLLKTPIFCETRSCTFVCEGTVNGAASALDSVGRDLSMDNYLALDHWDRQVVQLPLFINGIGGLGAPFWRPDLESRFHGEGSPREKMVAVAESIAFLLTVNLEAMTGAGLPIGRIILSGGLSRFRWLTERLAALNRVPVTVAEDAEATARGAAFLLAHKPANWKASDGKNAVVNERDLSPEKVRNIRARYREWRRLMPGA
jgi:glycerol kinase